MSINKKILATVLIILGLFGTYIIFGTLQTQITSSIFVNPDWARLECAPTDSYEGVYDEYLDNQVLYSCNFNTEECRVKIFNDNEYVFGFAQPAEGTYQKCDINGNNCGAKVSYDLGVQEIKTLPLLKVGESYKFATGIFVTNEEQTFITLEYKPWKLYRFVGGAKFEQKSDSCKISSDLNSGILSSEYPGSQLYRTGGEGQKWINYVNAWNYGPATNVFKHSSYGEVYCNAGQIYDIVELRMEDGSLKKIDPSYGETLPDGERLSGMGSKLANVECCPNEPNCGDDFKYKETQPSCFTDAQCTNAGGPIPVSNTQYIKFTCENSKCEKQGPFTVECTNNAQCADGEICDLSTLNYGKCTVSVATDYCGDKKCGLGETVENCPVDCANIKQCSWYETPIRVTEKQCGIGCWTTRIGTFGIINPTKEVEYDDCAISNWVYLAAMGLIVILLFSILLFLPRGGKNNGK